MISICRSSSYLLSQASRTFVAGCQTREFRLEPPNYANKAPRLKTGAWGETPLITEADYIEAKEKESDLEYKSIRFNRLWESGTSLYDHEYERFVRYVMKGGQKALAYQLMHETFYHLKSIQFARKLKNAAKNKEASTAEPPDNSTATPAGGSDGEELAEVVEMDPLTILKKALLNCEPVVITKRVKRGGAIYQVPYPITAEQGKYYSIKWMIDSVRERPKRRVKKFPEVLAHELLDAFHNRGKVVKKRDDLHRLADANKAFAHYRWG